MLGVEFKRSQDLLNSKLRQHEQQQERYMNKAELIELIAGECKMTKAQTERMLDTTIEAIKKTVKKGDEVKLVGFGTFTKAKRKARMGRNPQTGKAIKIPAMSYPKFRPGAEFKDIVR
ncbi:MAG: HU family DNA-binding protein [Bdellovibrionales bacterium]|nr:HU family DNA-binding protein [Bdellovibrionales bacterium]